MIDGNNNALSAREFAALGILGIAAVLIGATVAAGASGNLLVLGAFIIVIAMLLAAILQLHGIRPVNVIQPGLHGFAAIVLAFRHPSAAKSLLGFDDDILDLTPYRVSEKPIRRTK